MSTVQIPSSPASRTLSFQQIESVWEQAGGSPQAAPLMAGIAESESGGNPTALNNNPATGDYSVGLWQINYFGNLAGPRTARYGTPAQVMDPLANAKAAVNLYAGGSGLSNWAGDHAYALYQQGGIGAVIAQYGGDTGGQTISPIPSSSLSTSVGGASSSSAGGITGAVAPILKEAALRVFLVIAGLVLLYLGLRALPTAIGTAGPIPVRLV